MQSLETMKVGMVSACGGRHAYQVTHDDVIETCGGRPRKLFRLASDETVPMLIRAMALLITKELSI